MLGTWALITGDLHWGDGSKRDTALYANSDRLVDEFLSNDDYSTLIIVGDFEDLWKAAWSQIVLFNRHRFEHLGRETTRRGKRVLKVNGNHDYWDDIGEQRLAYEALSLYATIYPDFVNFGKWRFEHGNRFDPWNNNKSILNPVARGLTTTVGWLERYLHIPIEGTRVDPSRFYSPSNLLNELQDTVHRKAEDWAKKTKTQLCIGHTHYHHLHLGQSWALGNPGGLTKSHPYSYLRLETTSGYMEKVLPDAGQDSEAVSSDGSGVARG